MPKLAIETKKVTSMVLPLPKDVKIVDASPAAEHLSSTSIYPACMAPYLLSTACSDDKVRFWTCQASPDHSTFEWKEWDMIVGDKESCLELDGENYAKFLI